MAPALVRRSTAAGAAALVCAIGLQLLSAGLVHAASAIEANQFDSPALERRYKGLIDEIRCPRCQNVNLSGSDAPIAKDLRITVHRLLHEGASDQDVRDYLQSRYGDFVLYDPPLKPSTYLLWFLPPALLLLGLGVLARIVWRRATAPASVALSAAEQARLDALLNAADRTD